MNILSFFFNYNTPENIEACGVIVQDAAKLLYYSHIPTAVVALLIGIFILYKNRANLLSKILFLITLLFALWTSLDLLVWLYYDNSTLITFLWSFFGIIHILIYILSLYFVVVFINGKDVSVGKKIVFGLLISPIILLAPTIYNISGFSAVDCIALEGSWYTNYYLFGGLLLALFIIPFSIYKRNKVSKDLRKQLLFLTLGIESFLLVFFALVWGVTYLIDNGYILYGNYNIEQYGLFSMPIFMAFLAYLIVRFKTFNIKLIGAQALIVAMIALVGAQFFFIQSNTNRILTAVTLVILGIVGINLIRSVKREIEQREKIEKLARDLEAANEKLKELDQLKSEFLSLATHQIRAPLTAIKGYSSMLLEGDFGVLPPKAKDSAETIMKSSQNLVNIVEDFLNISRIEQGRMVYEKSIFDLGELVKETANDVKPNIDKAGLSLELDVPDNILAKVNADRGKIKQVIGNIIDNAIKYTERGSIKISMSVDGGSTVRTDKVKVAIKDTGVGIDPKDMHRLFAKFSRAKDAGKTNIYGTGLGLYIAKKMTEDHGGDIKVSSEGVGHGTTFTVELPRA